jgi:predicted Fe-Mo cluster-binding NifX family protein
MARNLIRHPVGGKMRLAVPEHQGRIAPVFDCCKRLMIVMQLPLEDELLQNEDWASLPRLTRAARLMELKVELLVCGGISCWMEEQIRRHGIPMIPWVAGDVWEVLAALRQGRILDPQYAMPGRAGCTRRRRGQGCGRSNHSQELFQKELRNA